MKGTMLYLSQEEAETTEALWQLLHVRPHVVSKPPPEWTEPSPELEALVEGMACRTEAYQPGGRVLELKKAVEAAGVLDKQEEVEGKRSDYPTGLVLSMDDYSEAGRRVLEAGYTFYVDETGKPHISRLEKTVVDMATGKIQVLAREAGIEDEAALDALDTGTRSNAAVPEVTCWFPNHNGAFQNKAEVSKHMAAEVKAGFSFASREPPMIPICVRPVNLIAKMKPMDGAMCIVGWRMVIDASYPGKNAPDSTAVGADGVERPQAPNFNYNRLLEGGYNWSSVGEIGKGVQVLMALAVLCDVGVVGKCYDFKSWFRQLPMCHLDRWKVVEAWGGEY
jgi:hypothetical protein